MMEAVRAAAPQANEQWAQWADHLQTDDIRTIGDLVNLRREDFDRIVAKDGYSAKLRETLQQLRETEMQGTELPREEGRMRQLGFQLSRVFKPSRSPVRDSNNSSATRKASPSPRREGAAPVVAVEINPYQCTNCGHNNPPKMTKFCFKCGLQLEVARSRTPSPAPSPKGSPGRAPEAARPKGSLSLLGPSASASSPNFGQLGANSSSPSRQPTTPTHGQARQPQSYQPPQTYEPQIQIHGQPSQTYAQSPQLHGQAVVYIGQPVVYPAQHSAQPLVAQPVAYGQPSQPVVYAQPVSYGQSVSYGQPSQSPGQTVVYGQPVIQTTPTSAFTPAPSADIWADAVEWTTVPAVSAGVASSTCVEG